MQSFILYAFIGGALGALLGYYSKCSSGTCAWMANWHRGALHGAGLAVSFCLLTGCGQSATEMNESTANVKHISQEQFKAEVTEAKLPVVVDCYATWCGPCKRLAPVMDSLANAYAGKIKFVKVNVDESPEVARQFNIEGIPMLLFFKDGKLVTTSVGLLSKKDLVMRLETLLQSNAQPPAPATAPGV